MQIINGAITMLLSLPRLPWDSMKVHLTKAVQCHGLFTFSQTCIKSSACLIHYVVLLKKCSLYSPNERRSQSAVSSMHYRKAAHLKPKGFITVVNVSATSRKGLRDMCWFCWDHKLRSLIVEIATILSWSSAAVSEWVVSVLAIQPGINIRWLSRRWYLLTFPVTLLEVVASEQWPCIRTENSFVITQFFANYNNLTNKPQNRLLFPK